MLASLLAVEVVRTADETGRPADQVLREHLRRAGLDSAAAAGTARAVFAWYRWRGFVSESPTHVELAALRRAVALADRFAREPGQFADVALLDGALPGWWRQSWPVSPALVRALQTEPDLWLRSRPGRAERLSAALAEAEVRCVPGVPDAVRYRGDADVFRSGPFRAGDCEIQDIASQAVGVVCAPQPGETWWDACAGEGGKTLHLCDLMQNRGVVWASDRAMRRLEVLRRRAARAKLFNLRIVPWSGETRPPTRTLFHGVLVDAPCTGVGTWHRNPHARWTTGPVDVQELAAVQAGLLNIACRSVRPGGRLIYAVCTLTRPETEGVVNAFAASHPEFEPAPFTDPFSREGTPVTQVAWEPQTTGGNGMFVAAWRRVR